MLFCNLRVGLPFLFTLFLSIWGLSSCGNQNYSSQPTNYDTDYSGRMIPITIGETKLRVHVYEKNVNPQVNSLLFFNMHDNENTSTRAAKAVIKQQGGKLIELVHTKARLITFTVKGSTKNFSIDPNRIFSEDGIEATLKMYNNISLSSALGLKVVDAVTTFTEKLMDILHQEGLSQTLVTLHNNTENGGLTINSYKENQFKNVYVNPRKDVDNFYYVTEEASYNYFKEKKFNVVLHDLDVVVDLGSLAGKCNRDNINYINIEAQLGSFDEQVKMIQEVYRHFE